MTQQYGFDGKVAIVTGAGGGLGRAYAMLLASRGARVIVNDLGGTVNGEGGGNAMADQVVAEIKAAGGEAAPSYDSVEEGGKLVQAALDHFGQIDIVVNNAGILRDKTFHKMSEDDWNMTYRVHLFGSFQVTHAAWPHMRKAGYGRIVMASSSSGLYGNFGQTNYGAMKMGLVGMANTLAIEGKKYNIGVNCFAPYGATRMTEQLLPPQMLDMTKPDKVAPLIAYLCHESFEGSGLVFEVGGGFMAQLRLQRSAGHLFPMGEAITIEDVAANWEAISNFDEPAYPQAAADAYAMMMKNMEK